jgi:hypothetical protein
VTSALSDGTVFVPEPDGEYGHWQVTARDELGGNQPARETREPGRILVGEHAAEAFDREL